MADKKVKNKSVLKKVFSYIGKYKYYLILSMLFAAVTVGLTLYAPILVGHAIDCIVGKDNVDFDLMKSILIKVAIIVIATAIIQWLMNVCNNKITYNVSRDLRKKAFEKIEILPFSYIDTHSKGDVVSRVIADVDQLSDGLLMGFTQFFTGVITIIGTLAFMLSVNVFITIVVVIVTPLSFFIAKFIAKKTFNMFSLQTKTRGKQTAFIDEMISNQKVADAYSKFLATQKGTVLHAFAAQCISLGQKLPKSQKTLNMYVNDAIGYKMTPEQVLFYSENCFGTADSISYRSGLLRIHDLKTGVIPAHMEQLMIYAALFCLEYKVKPADIDMELRIYQNNEVLYHNPTAEDIVPIMDKIITFDKVIRKIKEQEG